MRRRMRVSSRVPARAATAAAIVALLLIVVVMDLGLGVAERRFLRWRPRTGMPSAVGT